MPHIQYTMKTEEEANNLVCPLCRHPNTVVSGTHCTADVHFDSAFTSNCISSKCNLWVKTGMEEDHMGWCGLTTNP